ncbi:CBS domain-containing protein [Aliiroseovarius halocynthiae]|uniref:CBS domain-containing protein n=1 Tax=Aliiroseovarius halocynthiae TaxID=985055 RepID=A0A545SUC9_9RHOB|nr:CBS domain-containing protein [Aliiroseovarius halocynthiae]TQV68576.1 CBS domain-containing protein [Aliiroseovarius halocynthiae]SMR70984.1 CBS domain-containing protein [Aliiroseovarius halocynthiae]
MPTSYQAPMRKDREGSQSHSQDPTSNLKTKSAVVGDILSRKGAAVIAIRPGETLGRAVEVLRDERIGALVVTDEAGALCGILSERDIVRKLADTPGQTLPQLVQDVMTKEVETCSAEDGLVSVLKRMSDGRFRHMPVMGDAGPVGMVTIGDVISHRLNEVEHEALQLKQLIVG